MLKQLMLSKKIESLRNTLNEYLEEEQKLVTRSVELESAIEEAQTDEEIAAVEEEVSALEKEKTELEKKKSKLEGEIAELEGELEELNSKKPSNDQRNKGDENMKDKEFRDKLSLYVRTKGKVLRDDPVEPEEPEIVGFKVVDGGVLIPEEILAPQKEKKDSLDLTKYVHVIKTNRGSGKIPLIKKSGSKMNTVAELEKNPELAKPEIDDVSFDIETYRGYIPVSQEAIEDADYDIAGLIAEEIADQELNTKNAAIVNILKSAPAPEYDDNEDALPVVGIDGLKTVINTKLKRVYNVKLFVSSSLYNELDITKDKNGRYLLQDSISSASGKTFAGREVIVLDDDVIGEQAGDKVAFVGDAYEFVKLFDRKRASVKWVDNNIYGELLAGFVRFDTVAFDENAGYYFEYVPAEEESDTLEEESDTPGA